MEEAERLTTTWVVTTRVVATSIKSVNAVLRRDGAGGRGGAFDNNLGGYHTRGGDIYQERQRRTEESANSQRRFRRPTRRELGIGAAASGGLAAGIAGINSLINGEREEREAQR